MVDFPHATPGLTSCSYAKLKWPERFEKSIHNMLLNMVLLNIIELFHVLVYLITAMCDMILRTDSEVIVLFVTCTNFNTTHPLTCSGDSFVNFL